MREHPVDSPVPGRTEGTARTTAGWSALLGESLLDFHVEADDPRTFRGHLRSRRAGEVELIEMATAGHVSRRDARAEAADCVVCLQLDGVGEVHQDGRGAVLRPGDLVMFDAARASAVVSSARFRNVCVKFPRRLLPIPAEYLGQLTAARIEAGEGLAPATAALMTTLGRVLDELSEPARGLAARNLVDLVTTMFHGVLALPAPGEPAERPARFEQLRDYIDAHLGDPALSPGSIAAAQYVSLRKLHNVFQQHGTTVAAWIRERRLEQCRRDLRTTPDTVATIARRWGFKTPSHFGRVFKDAHGLTPAEFRRLAA
ncbi:helix-turn-helix domain-containing protein [Amycolatopsis rhabdoformis]|uniref:Helix-turn-helix domain-containing protein n=1 Tax=Amycolatopsis rhabdoformis TaxID=1448059 RepID=A0ABZ1IKG7_9PSEU|nr:helix-turn-helix domain-containing protein [Amycolatopsis rhabdoformis]WSE34266.1 helix-turn-helix domain-containing protein [Amycolatopsis rhabdoformis]